jgi:hypothetical protein
MSSIEDRVDVLEKENVSMAIHIKELQSLVSKLEAAVPVKNAKWTKKEESFLYLRAAASKITRDDIVSRSTTYLRFVMMFQKHFDRSERAVTMRLQNHYFK